MLVAVGSHSWEEGVLGDRCAASASSVRSSGKLKSLLIRPGRFLCVSMERGIVVRAASETLFYK